MSNPANTSKLLQTARNPQPKRDYQRYPMWSIERDSGAERRLAFDGSHVSALAAAGEVVYADAGPDRLHAVGRERLWGYPPTELEFTLERLQPLAGRLYGVGSSGQVFCLEERGSESG